MSYPIIPRDYLLIKVDREYNDEVEVAGAKLALDTSYEPTWHVRIFGEVVSTPRAVVRYVNGNPKDEPAFELEHNVRVGDRVYFHFHTVGEHNRIKYLSENNIYKLHHKQVFCAVRYEPMPIHRNAGWQLQKLRDIGYEMQPDPVDGFLVYKKEDHCVYVRIGEDMEFFTKRIIMANGRILVQPRYEGWEKCVFGGRVTYKTPNPKSLDDIDTGGGIIVKTQPCVIPLQGIVRHVGRPEKGHREELGAGDYIAFTKDSEFENEIEGEKFYVMSHSDVVGKLLY